MGSTSFQIAFEPEYSNKLPSKYSEQVILNGQKYSIYVHSYLCFGQEEFTRRYYAKLTKVC